MNSNKDEFQNDSSQLRNLAQRNLAAHGTMPTARPNYTSNTVNSVEMSADDSAMSYNQFPNMEKLARTIDVDQFKQAQHYHQAESANQVTQQHAREKSPFDLTNQQAFQVSEVKNKEKRAQQTTLSGNQRSNIPTRIGEEERTPTVVEEMSKTNINDETTLAARLSTVFKSKNSGRFSMPFHTENKIILESPPSLKDDSFFDQKQEAEVAEMKDLSSVFQNNHFNFKLQSVQTNNSKTMVKNAGNTSQEPNISSISPHPLDKSRNMILDLRKPSTVSQFKTREQGLNQQVSNFSSSGFQESGVLSRQRSNSMLPEGRISKRLRRSTSDGSMFTGRQSPASKKSMHRLESAADALKVAIEAKRNARIYQELMTAQGYVDPTPDMVEGIFYLDKTSCFERCMKSKQDSEEHDQANDTIVIYDRKSLYLFDHQTKFRKWTVNITHTHIFEAFIVLVIILNSIVLMITDYGDRENKSDYNMELEQIGKVFNYIFILEFVLKVIAMGFIMHPKSYIRDPWNWIDFIVVITGLIELFVGTQGAQSVRSLRVLRVLRPLQVLHSIPEMTRLISALLSSLPNLGNAVLFMFFIFLLFGILGVQQFRNKMYQRCRFTDLPNADGTWPIDESIEFLCSKDSYGNYQCPEDRYCHRPADGNLDIAIDEIHNEEMIDYGISSFQNLALSMVTVFQFVTLEGWAKIMYNLMDSSSQWMAVFFSFFLVMIGAYFLINVILSVLVQALEKVEEVKDKANAKHNRFIKQSLDRKKLQEDAKKEQLIIENSSLSKTQQKQGIYDAQLQSIKSNLSQPAHSSKNQLDRQEFKKRTTTMKVTMKNVCVGPFESSQSSSLKNESMIFDQNPQLDNENLPTAGRNPEITLNQGLTTTELGTLHLFTGDPATARLKSETMHDLKNDKEIVPHFSSSKQFSLIDGPLRLNQNNNLMSPIQEQAEPNSQSTLRQITEPGEQMHTGRVLLDTETKVEEKKILVPTTRKIKPNINVQVQPLNITDAPQLINIPDHSLELAESKDWASNLEMFVRKTSLKMMPGQSNCLSCHNLDIPERAKNNCLYRTCFIVCTHFLFTVFICILIVINTIVLAFDQHPRDLELYDIADQINVIVIWFFVAEMIVKIIGLGVKDYMKDPYNVFDAIIVIISLIDFALLQIPDISADSGGALSGFRAIRLLRVFKLAKNWPTLKKLLHTIMLTMKDVATFSILLLICMLIFTLLGMELFGDKVKFDEFDQVAELGNPPRANFDTHYMAFLTIFIIFIGEDWQTVMQDHYRVEGTISLFFFMITYVFLNLILLNLFLAILLQNFKVSEDNEAHKDNEQKTYTRLRRTCRRCCQRLKCCGSRRVTPGRLSRNEQNNIDDTLKETEKQSSDSSSISSDQSPKQDRNRNNKRSRAGRQNSLAKRISAAQERNKLEAFVNPKDESFEDDEVRMSRMLPMLPIVMSKNKSVPDPQLHIVSQESYKINVLNREGLHTDSQDSSSQNNVVLPAPDQEEIKIELGTQNYLTMKPLLALESIDELEKDSSASQSGVDKSGRDRSDSFFNENQHVIKVSITKNPKQNPLDIKMSKTVGVKQQGELLTHEQKIRHVKSAGSTMSALERRNRFKQLGRSKSDAQIKFESKLYLQKKTLLAHSTIKMSIAHLKKVELFENQSSKKSLRIKPTGKSCGICGPSNPLRLVCKSIVEFKYYDMIVIILILLSTILLMLDNPLNDQEGKLAQWITRIDIIVTALFTIECVINVIFLGFVFNGPLSYLHDSWNILDFIIVLCSLVSIVSVSLNLEFLKIFRLLRVLRPLRMLKRNFGLKIQVVSLLNSIPNIANLLAITALLLMLFGIQGVNFFAGKLYYCNMNQSIPKHIHEKVLSQWDCYDYGGEWLLPDSNFDHIGHSMLTMFTMMTTEGWNEVMWKAIDATEIHQVPQRDYRPVYILFFVVFMIFGFLFILNLFVGVVLNTFHLEKDKLSHNNELTKLQHEYLEVMKNCYLMQPQKQNKKSGNRLRDWCKEAANSRIFNQFILVCIVLNSIGLSITYSIEETERITTIMNWVNIVFTLIYTVEMVIKITAIKKQYFHDGWNVFDFAIVVLAWIGVVSEHILDININILTTMRAFRILRVLKLIHQAKNLEKILNTFLLAIPELANVGALLFLFLILFGVLGVFLFSGIKLQTDLNNHANFQSFELAMLTLFRIISGENWQAIMYDCSRPRGILFQCTLTQDYAEQQRDGINGCGTPIAYLYFVSFMLVVSVIFLNLFIAIILEGQLQATQQQETRVTEVTRNAFTKYWSKYDPKAKGMIKIEDFQELIMDLVEEEQALFARQNSPLDVRNQVMFNFASHKELKVLTKIKRNLKLDAQEEAIKAGPKLLRQLEWSFKKFISAMQLPVYDHVQYYNFHDCLAAFATLVFSDTHKKQFEERKKRIEEAKAALKSSTLKTIDKIEKEGIEYWKLDVMDQEKFLQVDDPDFQTVINRLENKGKDHNVKILKLNEVRHLRTKAGQKTKKKMALGYGGSFVLDSSHVIGVQRIMQFIEERKERKARIQAKIQEQKNKQDAQSRRLKFAKQTPASKSTIILPINSHKEAVFNTHVRTTREASEHHQPKFVGLSTPLDTSVVSVKEKNALIGAQEFPPSVDLSSKSSQSMYQSSPELQNIQPNSLSSVESDQKEKQLSQIIEKIEPTFSTFSMNKLPLDAQRISNKNKNNLRRNEQTLALKKTVSMPPKQKITTLFKAKTQAQIMNKDTAITRILKKSNTRVRSLTNSSQIQNKSESFGSTNIKGAKRQPFQQAYYTAKKPKASQQIIQPATQVFKMTSSSELTGSYCSDQDKNQNDFFSLELNKDKGTHRQQTISRSDAPSSQKQEPIEIEAIGDNDDRDGGIPNPTEPSNTLAISETEERNATANQNQMGPKNLSKKINNYNSRLLLDSKGGEAAVYNIKNRNKNIQVSGLDPLIHDSRKKQSKPYNTFFGSSPQLDHRKIQNSRSESHNDNMRQTQQVLQSSKKQRTRNITRKQNTLNNAPVSQKLFFAQSRLMVKSTEDVINLEHTKRPSSRSRDKKTIKETQIDERQNRMLTTYGTSGFTAKPTKKSQKAANHKNQHPTKQR